MRDVCVEKVGKDPGRQARMNQESPSWEEGAQTDTPVLVNLWSQKSGAGTFGGQWFIPPSGKNLCNFDVNLPIIWAFFFFVE